jgi:hypothetical protein
MKEETEDKYSALEKSLHPFRELMDKAISALEDKEITNYPIFVVHKQELELGIPIIDREKTPFEWNLHVSSLEEFVTKQLIQMEKTDEFIKVFKEHTAHYCIFALSELGAQFVFLKK